MSTETAAAFLDRIENDEAFATEMESLKGDWQVALARIRSAGFDVSETEVRDAVLERYGSVLSPEQLDALAAGIDEVTGSVVVGVGTAGVVAFAAAAVAALS